jgi:hypothetical protein
MKPVFTPEKVVGSNEPLLAPFYDVRRVTTKGETDPINPPHFRISRELMGRVIHTLRREYISDDEHGEDQVHGRGMQEAQSRKGETYGPGF